MIYFTHYQLIKIDHNALSILPICWIHEYQVNIMHSLLSKELLLQELERSLILCDWSFFFID